MSFLKFASLGLVSTLGYLSTTRATPVFGNFSTNCDLTNVSLDALSQAGLTPPPYGQKLTALLIGIGTQNYTCNSAGTYSSIGAVATLFDASCISDFIFDVLSAEFNVTTLDDSATPIEVKLNDLEPLKAVGLHTFVANASGTPAGSISPQFDFRSGSAQGDPQGFVITNKTQGVKSPTYPAHNVDWLGLTAIPGDGDFASTVYRIFTSGGQPPLACTEGTIPFTLTIPYAANYWFFK